MGFNESTEKKIRRIESIRPDIEVLRTSMNEMGEFKGEPQYIREAVREACKAALKGNYGIGAVMVHSENIVGRGQNRLGEVENPMHHMLHAEMDALRDYHEKVNPDQRKHSDLCIYTTLEPCSMCTCGMFNAGVRKAIAGSEDPWAGQLISHRDKMPPLWLQLLKESGTEHTIADVPKALRDACNRVFMITKDALDRALVQS